MARLGRIRLIFALSFLFVGIVAGQESREVHKSGSFAKDGRLYVDTYKGSVNISTWDKAEIDIVARIESDASGRRAKDDVEDTQIRIDLGSSSARIKTDYDRVRRNHSFLGIFQFETDELPMVHYTIKVPRTVSVEVKDYKSKTSVLELESDLRIESYKGEIQVEKLSGSVNVKTYKGEARIEIADLRGRSRAETYKGEISLALPRVAKFDLDADIGRRADFRSDFHIERERSRSRSKEFDARVAVNGGGPVVQLKSDRGTVRLIER